MDLLPGPQKVAVVHVQIWLLVVVQLFTYIFFNFNWVLLEMKNKRVAFFSQFQTNFGLCE